METFFAVTKEECQSRKMSNGSEDRIYETMLSVADRFNIINLYKDKEQFVRRYKAYSDFTGELDWEMMMAESAKGFKYSAISNALFESTIVTLSLMPMKFLLPKVKNSSLTFKRLVDEHPGYSFTITIENIISHQVITGFLPGMRMERY